MSNAANQSLVLIEGVATYERILAELRELETDEAIRHILDFIRIYPDFAVAHNDLAVLFHREGNLLKALAHHEKAHKLDPGNIVYRKNLADFYFVELEWAGDAVRTYLDILKDNPFDIEALNALGTISLQLGRKEQARQYFSRTLQLDADNVDARQALQQLPAPTAPSPEHRQISRELDSVNRQFQQRTSSQFADASLENRSSHYQPTPAPTVLPGADELYLNAVSQANNGDAPEAIHQLENLLSYYPDFALAHNDLGVLYQKSGELSKSRQHHETAARLQPDNELFQRNLADLLCAGFGELEEALSIYVKLLSQNQYDIDTLKAIAHICLEVGQKSDAEYFLQKILSIQPWDEDARSAIRSLNENVV